MIAYNPEQLTLDSEGLWGRELKGIEPLQMTAPIFIDPTHYESGESDDLFKLCQRLWIQGPLVLAYQPYAQIAYYIDSKGLLIPNGQLISVNSWDNIPTELIIPVDIAQLLDPNTVGLNWIETIFRAELFGGNHNPLDGQALKTFVECKTDRNAITNIKLYLASFYEVNPCYYANVEIGAPNYTNKNTLQRKITRVDYNTTSSSPAKGTLL